MEWKLKNDYEIRGDVTAIFLKRQNGEVFETLIDTNDLEKAKTYPNTWFAHYKKSVDSFYVASRKQEKGKRIAIYLHRFLLNEPRDLIVDHINHNTLDNTKKNLRIVTHAQNMQNLSGAQKNSKSGILGVSWDKCRNKWRVQMHVNGKKTHIGLFEDIKEAEKVAIESRKKAFPFLTKNQEVV